MCRPVRVLALLVLALAALPGSASATAIVGTTSTTVAGVEAAAPGSAMFSLPITGLEFGDAARGIDERPATGDLVLVARNGAGAGRLYRLDLATGEASAPVTLAADPADPTDPYTGLPGSALGVDIDPAADRLRIVGADGTNLRVDPSTGAVVTGSPVAGPAIDALAFTDNEASTPTTTLLGHDFTGNAVGTFPSPDDGVFAPLGPTGFTAELPSDAVAMDVARDGTAYLTARAAGAARLFRVSTATGAATDAGVLGLGGLVGMTAVDNTMRLADGGPRPAAETGETRFTVVRASPVGTASVAYATSAGSASAESDFAPASGTLTFTPGEVAKTISVLVRIDDRDEPDETFTLQLARSGRAQVLPGHTATVTITDDDPAPVNPTPTAPADGDGPRRGRCANAKNGTNGDDGLVGTRLGDRLNGLRGSDGVFGLTGNDCVVGGPGDDYVSGGGGRDDLQGNSGADRLIGGTSPDRLSGGSGADRLSGGSGADALSGGSGANRMSGGSGDDTFAARNGRRDLVDCGAGRDRVTADRRDRLRRCEIVMRARR